MDLHEKINNITLQLKDEVYAISDYIFDNPEIGDEEFLSSKYLVDLLRKYGFKVEYPYLGMETAFRAELGNTDYPTIAFLSEYDALPGYGIQRENAHACGHNWIAATTVGAALVLSKLGKIFEGKLVVIGTPAEETVGRKVDMVKKGIFDDIDAVFQMHLSVNTSLNATALAMDSYEFKFKGKASHAAAYPHEGINALDAVNLTFAGINALRQHVKPDVRIHGIITDGGYAPNIVPDNCACRISIRASKRSYLNEVSEKVKNCARGAAIMTGTELEISNFENSYDDLIVNSTLKELAYKNFTEAGFDDFSDEAENPGSTDIGNVSYAAPTIYGNIKIGDGTVKVHEEDFLKYANSDEAKEKALMVVKAFAYSAVDLCKNPEILKKAREEFINLCHK